MPERLNYHFEPRTGWMNDPNGLIFYKGKYHAFFQHNPYKPVWGPMHWGHAVSDDLIHWQELEIALRPDMEYENTGGCFSGSAVEKDGVLYLFYTSVSERRGQTQSVAVSRDGIHFEKYEGNPVIPVYPADGSGEFRDPKVSFIKGHYYMVCGSGKDGVGKILLYRSDDLLHWDYVGVLFEDAACGTVLECPDLFELDGKFVLMFSKMGIKTHMTQFVVGSFDGEKFTEEYRCTPEGGPQFYAPQTFLDGKGRRIIIGWLYDWEKPLDEGADYAGALTIPREMRIVDGKVMNYPVEEACGLLKNEDELVAVNGRSICINNDITFECASEVEKLDVLKDTKTVEIFVNGGEDSFTYWFGK